MKRKGYYFGTEVKHKQWWRKYTHGKHFMRGQGQWWYDSKAFHFKSFVDGEEIKIPFNKIQEIKIGKWHGGRLAILGKAVKIIWKENNHIFDSGFLVSKKISGAKRLQQILAKKIS